MRLVRSVARPFARTAQVEADHHTGRFTQDLTKGRRRSTAGANDDLASLTESETILRAAIERLTPDAEEIKPMLDNPDVVILDVRRGQDWTSSEFKIQGLCTPSPKPLPKRLKPTQKTRHMFYTALDPTKPPVPVWHAKCWRAATCVYMP